MNTAIMDNGNIVPLALFKVEFKSAVVSVGIVHHEESAELVSLRQSQKVVSDNGANGVNFTMLGIKVMAEDIILCLLVEIRVRPFINGEYARHKVLFFGFSPNSVFGKCTKPRTWNSNPRLGIQRIPYRSETSFTNHINFKVNKPGDREIFEKRNFQEGGFGNAAMRKEAGNNGLWINIEMKRNSILQNGFDAFDVSRWRSQDMILGSGMVMFQRKDECRKMRQMPVVAHECKMNGVCGCHDVNLLFTLLPVP